MAAPAFGFSVGDFIAGIKLVKDLIKSLNDASGARPAYLHLISELVHLEDALTTVRNLDVDPAQAAQKIALEQVASQCHESIETFLSENAKFQATLGVQAFSKPSRWRTNLHKIQWALFKDDAVNELRAKITGHTTTINMILNAMQMASLSLQEDLAKSSHHGVIGLRDAENKTQALVKKNHDMLNTQADLIVAISRTVTAISTKQETRDLQSIVHKVLETNMRIFAMVLEMQKLLQSELPPQVDRQQPVYFEDALGRIAPFHVEFICSFEAFQAVLEARFRDVPGLKKVQNIEYVMQDSRSNTAMDFRKRPWASLFLPGRKVNMSMVFRNVPRAALSCCPGCRAENAVEEGDLRSEIQCANPLCRLLYQRIDEIDSNVENAAEVSPIRLGKRTRDHSGSLVPRKRTWASTSRRYEEDESEDDDIHQFRRVQVVQIPKRVFSKANFSLVALARAIQQPVEKGGVRIQNRRWHLRLHYNCFIGSDMTSWLLDNFEDLEGRQEAEALGSSLMASLEDRLTGGDIEAIEETRMDDGGLFVHVEKRHPFRDGNYYYQISADYAKPRPPGWFKTKRS